jgi:hypothetical protein
MAVQGTREWRGCTANPISINVAVAVGQVGVQEDAGGGRGSSSGARCDGGCAPRLALAVCGPPGAYGARRRRLNG